MDYSTSNPDMTMIVPDDKKSSQAILQAIDDYEVKFTPWFTWCRVINDVYSRDNALYSTAQIANDTQFNTVLDIHWASLEVLKPAVYAKAPVPAVATQFKDRNPVKIKTAEVIERVVTSGFDRSNVDDVMVNVRNDLLMYNRGVKWICYENYDGKQCFHDEHVFREDFAHDPARKWADVGWVARRSWLNKDDVKKRFGDKIADDVTYSPRLTVEERFDNMTSTYNVAGIWEVWHKADNRTYWVCKGVPYILDDAAPEFDFPDFFPCPRPAYGTLKPDTLIPVPDYTRYAVHFNKINKLTARIYTLLDSVKMKGIMPVGNDVGEAITKMMAQQDDMMVIGVPEAAMSDKVSQLITWLPLAEIAQTIQGLIEVRTQLISDYYELSGISDIMRGATEAQETLGAQQLKSQYGSIRVQQKIDEMQRIAADAVKLAATIVCEKFTEKTILEMSQMEIPTEAELKKKTKEIETSGAKELRELAAQMQQNAQQIPPDQAQQVGQQFQQQQQQIVQKYSDILKGIESTVPIDAIMKLMRDDVGRCFAFTIETDSTILTDELQEKASRNEFMKTMLESMAGLQILMAAGEDGAELAGELLRFVLAPYRAGRQLDAMIDKFIDAAPQMAAQMGDQGESEELIAAQNKLAEAEMAKAQAQMAKVEADTQLKQAEMQTRMQQMEMDAAEKAAKLQLENGKLQQKTAELTMQAEKMQAEIDKIRAETMKTLTDAQIAVDNQALNQFKSLEDIEMRKTDQANGIQQQQTDTAFRAQQEGRANRAEDRSDRQQGFAEQQAMRESKD